MDSRLLISGMTERNNGRHKCRPYNKQSKLCNYRKCSSRDCPLRESFNFQ